MAFGVWAHLSFKNLFLLVARTVLEINLKQIFHSFSLIQEHEQASSSFLIGFLYNPQQMKLLSVLFKRQFGCLPN